MDYEFLEAFEAYSGVTLLPAVESDDDYSLGAMALEAFVIGNDARLESCEVAMEGNIIKGASQLKQLLSESKSHKSAMKKAADAGDFETAASEAETVAQLAGRCAAEIDSLPNKLASNLIVNIAILFLMSFVGKTFGKVETKLGHTATKAYNKNVEKIGKVGDAYDAILNTAMGTSSEGDGFNIGELMRMGAKEADPKIFTINHRSNQFANAGFYGMIANHIITSRKVKRGEVPPSEKNTLLVGIRTFANHMKASYTKLAAAYREAAKGESAPASESWLF